MPSLAAPPAEIALHAARFGTISSAEYNVHGRGRFGIAVARGFSSLIQEPMRSPGPVSQLLPRIRCK